MYYGLCLKEVSSTRTGSCTHTQTSSSPTVRHVSKQLLLLYLQTIPFLYTQWIRNVFRPFTLRQDCCKATKKNSAALKILKSLHISQTEDVWHVVWSYRTSQDRPENVCSLMSPPSKPTSSRGFVKNNGRKSSSPGVKTSPVSHPEDAKGVSAQYWVKRLNTYTCFIFFWIHLQIFLEFCFQALCGTECKLMGQKKELNDFDIRL